MKNTVFLVKGQRSRGVEANLYRYWGKRLSYKLRDEVTMDKGSLNYPFWGIKRIVILRDVPYTCNSSLFGVVTK